MCCDIFWGATVELEQERVRLTSNDIKALLFLSEQGYANIDQLWRYAWGHQKNSDYTYDRVLLLERSGYLKKVILNGFREKIVCATRLARNSVALISPFPVPAKIAPVATVAHQLGLNDLRIEMEAAGLTGWRSSESLMVDPLFRRIGLRHIPDAFYTSRKGIKTAIEYDRTMRKKERIKERLSLYLTELMSPNGNLDRVIYLVPLAYLDTYKNIVDVGFSGIKDRFVFATIDDFLKQIREAGK